VTSLTVSAEVAGERVILSLAGALDYTTVSSLREELDRVEARYAPRFVELDLSGVRHVDATGLGLLVAIAKRLRERDGDLRLRSVAPEAMAVLELTGLDWALGAHESGQP
jgi:anti-sigma B factor antagonist